jgi:catechol 2,3-dioxygenase-like lactoylglutathione lyase family enzyme
MTTRSHVSLLATDIERSVAFYSTLFASEPVKTRADYAKFALTNPPLNFSLNHVSSLSPGGTLSHLGVELDSTDEVAATRERITAAGLQARSEDEVTCCYSVQDKIWVRDPDGNEWEFFHVIADSETRDGPGKETGCCVPSPDTGPSSSCC